MPGPGSGCTAPTRAGSAPRAAVGGAAVCIRLHSSFFVQRCRWGLYLPLTVLFVGAGRTGAVAAVRGHPASLQQGLPHRNHRLPVAVHPAGRADGWGLESIKGIGSVLVPIHGRRSVISNLRCTVRAIPLKNQPVPQASLPLLDMKLALKTSNSPSPSGIRGCTAARVPVDRCATTSAVSRGC